MKVVHILRKPLIGSVAENILKHGCGALDIDRTRIGFTGDADKWAAGSGGLIYGAYMDGSGQVYKGEQYKPTQNTSQPHNGGRWPANLVLQHLPGCHQEGMRRVKGSPTSRTFHEAYDGEGVTRFLRGHSHPGNQHADADGMETVAAWECEPGCPVADLDDQSGERPVSGAAKTGRPAVGGQTGGCVVSFGIERGNGTLHNDAGGAARFFKQVQSSDE